MGVILLVRHGQASFGSADYDQLSPLGQEQARVLGQAIGPRIAQLGPVVVGTMRRHRQTAELFLEAMGSGRVLLEDGGFDEFDHEEVIANLDAGSVDAAERAAGLAGSADPRRAFQELFTRAIERWASGRHDADYKESWEAFRNRCLGAFERVGRSLGRAETALVFSSGGPIAAIMASVLPIAPERAYELQLRLVNAGVSKVLHGSRGPSFGSLNDHSHFEHAGRRLITHG